MPGRATWGVLAALTVCLGLGATLTVLSIAPYVQVYRSLPVHVPVAFATVGALLATLGFFASRTPPAREGLGLRAGLVCAAAILGVGLGLYGAPVGSVSYLLIGIPGMTLAGGIVVFGLAPPPGANLSRIGLLAAIGTPLLIIPAMTIGAPAVEPLGRVLLGRVIISGMLAWLYTISILALLTGLLLAASKPTSQTRHSGAKAGPPGDPQRRS